MCILCPAIQGFGPVFMNMYLQKRNIKIFSVKEDCNWKQFRTDKKYSGSDSGTKV